MDEGSAPPRRRRELAEGGTRVLRLSELTEVGVGRGVRRAAVQSGRWVALPRRGVVTDRGPLDQEAGWRAALIAVGASARLGGISALQVAGLTGYEEPVTHVWVAKSRSRARLVPGVRVHETRRWCAADAETSGLPRSTPPVAAVQAALWSRSARQAALCLVMPVQQRIVGTDDLLAQLERVRRHPFRRVLLAVLADVADGAQSLNELDVARMCRERGLPEPDRQVPRRGPGGLRYLDVYWSRYRVALEINGIGHDALDQSARDDIRLLDLQLDGDAALTLGVLTLRTDPDPFFARLGSLLRQRGWTG